MAGMNTQTFSKLLKRPRDLRPLIRLLVPLITVAMVVWAVLLYRRSNREVEQRYNDKLVHLARSTAARFGQTFQVVKSFLRMAGNMDVVTQQREVGGEALATIVDQLRVHGALQACLVDHEGKVQLASGQKERLTDLFRGGPPCSVQDDICLRGPVPSKISPSGLIMIAMMPVSRGGEAARRPTKNQLALVLDWGASLKILGEVAKLSKNTFAWVQDHRGRLIYHPRHGTQLGFDTQNNTSSCMRCHLSFELNQRMMRQRQGIGEILLKDREPMVAAYASFEVGNRRWSAAVGTPSLVTRESGKSLAAISLFAGLFIIVIVGGAMLLDRESSRRIRDVTSFNRQLELKVAERTREVQQLYSRYASLQSRHTRLERVSVAGEMASIVAHEVRTPLNALSINAQLISRMLRTDMDKNRDKALEVITTLEVEIERVNKLLEEHLLSLVRQSPVDLQPLNLNNLIIDCTRFMKPEARRHDVKLVSDLAPRLPFVLADEAKLRQILINIIINAIQAIISDGTIHLKTWSEGNEVALSIRDTGPGIPEEDLDKIFRPFITTKEEGTGLGLAICSRLIKMMKGSITVSSREGDGACFELRLRVDQGSNLSSGTF